MAKAQNKPAFQCETCGATAPKWTGRCSACGAWNTIKEHTIPVWATGQSNKTPVARMQEGELRSRPITSIADSETGAATRLRTGIPAWDRVLGGGLVEGSLVLLGGDPGIGKSTLLLQVLSGLCATTKDASVLYVSGEESLGQTAQRARRLSAVSKDLRLYSETRLSLILEEAERLRPSVLAIDSVQMVVVEEVGPVPGSLAQIREATARLLPFAKQLGVAVLLIGHVTKDGALAGPKTLEHMVDAVLLFEGERGHPYRILRASKNRFGAISEIGVFEMQQGGLVEVRDPSAMLLAERPAGNPGSAVTCTVEGTMPLLVEVQALVASCAGVPRRTALGIDPYRVAMLIAVIERHAGIDIINQDVFINVAGGIRLEEPAADLAVALAICSSATRRPIDPLAVCFGEVGLSGEVRSVSHPEARILEAHKLGFRRVVMPAATTRSLSSARIPKEMEVIGVRNVGAAVEALLTTSPVRPQRYAPQRPQEPKRNSSAPTQTEDEPF